MEINIKHCNNIDLAKISIIEGKLNIKYAPNGTGKSTIATAIQCNSDNENNDLNKLIPFKYRENNPENNQPEVLGTEHIQSTMCFNEGYVNQFTFRPEELVSNSFDIFIRSDAYNNIEQEIHNIVVTIKQLFTNNSELETLISNLKELSSAFKLTKAGLSKSSTGMKGLSGGNKVEHIPHGLEPFQLFIQSQNNVSWIDWQTKGHKEFSDLSGNCPYCSTDTKEKKEQIKQVGKEFDKNVIKNLVGIIHVIDKLGEYFSEETKTNLAVITSLKDGLEKEHEAFIVNVKTQVDNLISKLEHLRTLSGFHFKEGEKVTEKLLSYKLDLQFFSTLNSEKTQQSITSINTSIDNLIEQAGILQGKINIQRREIKKLVEKHQEDINDFLSYAGYRYKVQIVGEDGQSQLKLQHIDHAQYLSGGDQHLSFGERNAFAIVLFMYECLSTKPELIILDDPISSFDKNKKFAILEMLFRRNAEFCLKGKTVLMLTHDIEPIIDTLKSVKKQFNNQVSASCLRFSNGQIVEHNINDYDIKTFAQICQNTIESDREDIIKLIYLRRHYEILDDRGDAYQILSNLFHLRGQPIDTREPRGEDEQYPEMDINKLTAGYAEVAEKIEDFNYGDALNRISDQAILKALYHDCENSYEKLQLFRLIGVDIDSSVIRKFINETYHIENEFICQLDPAQFDLIPEYVIDECNKCLEEVI